MNSKRYYSGYLYAGYSVSNTRNAKNNSEDSKRRIDNASYNIGSVTKVTGISAVATKLKSISNNRSNRINQIQSTAEILKNRYYEKYKEELKKEIQEMEREKEQNNAK